MRLNELGNHCGKYGGDADHGEVLGGPVNHGVFDEARDVVGGVQDDIAAFGGDGAVAICALKSLVERDGVVAECVR